jgi:hypothetical protein
VPALHFVGWNIVVAATAGRLALWRALNMHEGITPTLGDYLHPTLTTIPFLYLTARPLILIGTIGFMIIRLRQPRLRWRRIMNQPGTVSCIAVLGFFSIYGVMDCAACVATRSGLHRVDTMTGSDQLIAATPSPVGFAVGMSLVILALSKRWRYEHGWIDALGMVFGCYWALGALVVMASRGTERHLPTSELAVASMREAVWFVSLEQPANGSRARSIPDLAMANKVNTPLTGP